MRSAVLTGTLLLLAATLPLTVGAAEPPAAVVEGQLAKASVQKVLEGGPQRFVASLRVAPHLEKGRFLGFRIVGVLPESPLAGSATVVPGDVVLTVNDEPLERPEQFMRAWDVLKGAESLSVLVLRDGRRLLYRWKIVP